MVSRSRLPQNFVLPRWIRPFRHCWKPLIWIWGALFLGVFINVGSSWLLARRFDPTGTPLGWLASHLWITLLLLFLLLLLTLLARFASLQERAASPASSLALTHKQRLQFIGGFQQEYSSRLASSLQGQVALRTAPAGENRCHCFFGQPRLSSFRDRRSLSSPTGDLDHPGI